MLRLIRIQKYQANSPLHTKTRKHAYYTFDPLNPQFLYIKTGVYRGIHYLSYFCSKTYIVVLARTALPSWFYRVPTI